mmetsp:Transcript_7030/g.14349  ORF Transcript_7030/g.14349 Transcript_7030/m.14349 type:complete len:247 (-) Transcript_7030:706-1446(-)
MACFLAFDVLFLGSTPSLRRSAGPSFLKHCKIARFQNNHSIHRTNTTRTTTPKKGNAQNNTSGRCRAVAVPCPFAQFVRCALQPPTNQSIHPTNLELVPAGEGLLLLLLLLLLTAARGAFHGFRQGVPAQKVPEFPPGKPAAAVFHDLLPLGDDVQGREIPAFAGRRNATGDRLQQAPVLVGGRDLYHQHPAAEFRRQPLGRRRRLGLRGKDQCDRQAEPVCLGQQPVVVFLSGADPLDKLGHLVF